MEENDSASLLARMAEADQGEAETIELQIVRLCVVALTTPAEDPSDTVEVSGPQGILSLIGAMIPATLLPSCSLGAAPRGQRHGGGGMSPWDEPSTTSPSARSMEERETDGAFAGAAAFHHIATRALRYGGTAVEGGGSSSAGSTSDTNVLRGLRLRDPSNAWERSRIEHYLQFLASAMAEKNCSTMQVLAKLEQVRTN